MRRLVVLCAAFAAVSGFIIVQGARRSNSYHPPTSALQHTGSAGQWFERAKPFCNSVEVATWQRRNPAPDDMRGRGYSSACFALAGDIDRARERLMEIDAPERWKGAGIVFGVGHPVADAGDDLAAGPIMELVVEFWPNHHMALYHAGASRYQLGQHDAATEHLESFLAFYEPHDGWRRNALHMLEEIGG